jgi:hypothetical protein
MILFLMNRGDLRNPVHDTSNVRKFPKDCNRSKDREILCDIVVAFNHSVHSTHFFQDVYSGRRGHTNGGIWIIRSDANLPRSVVKQVVQLTSHVVAIGPVFYCSKDRYEGEFLSTYCSFFVLRQTYIT